MLIDLGSGVTLEPAFMCFHEPYHCCWGERQPCEVCNDKDRCPSPEQVGWIFRHPTPGEKWPTCGAMLYTREPWRNPTKPTPLWTIHSSDPLTLSPSVVCPHHGTHGFIRDGKWLPV